MWLAKSFDENEKNLRQEALSSGYIFSGFFFRLFRVLHGSHHQQDQVATMLAPGWAARQEKRSRPLGNESGLRNTQCAVRNVTAKADLLAIAVCQGATLAMNLQHQGKWLIVATDWSQGHSRNRVG